MERGYEHFGGQPEEELSPEKKEQEGNRRFADGLADLSGQMPERRWLFGAILLAFNEACATGLPEPKRPVTETEIAVEADRQQAEARLTEELAGGEVPEDVAPRVARWMLGVNAMTPAEWVAERDRRLADGGHQEVTGAESAGLPTAWAAKAVDFLPLTWTAPATNEGLAFLGHQQFRAELKEESNVGTITLCFSLRSAASGRSHIRCDSDALKDFGAATEYRTDIFHEMAHSASPRRLPLPAADKAKFWSATVRVLTTEKGRQESSVLSRLSELAQSAGTWRAYSTLYSETWAEHMATAFKPSEAMAKVDSWEAWQEAYTKDLLRHGLTAGAAYVWSETAAEYFRAIDPDYRPWAVAPALREWHKQGREMESKK
ncbi:MAG: hypothetical protein PHT12_02280 [Patescibacteria group bacterium]|nr:hypothetical protein [Patescibacteria group bacterium]